MNRTSQVMEHVDVSKSILAPDEKTHHCKVCKQFYQYECQLKQHSEPTLLLRAGQQDVDLDEIPINFTLRNYRRIKKETIRTIALQCASASEDS